MQVSSNNTLRLLSNIDLKKVEAQKEIDQCNASLAKIDKQLKNSHLSRITRGKLLENQVQLIERIDQLQFTLIKLNTLAQKVIARQNAPQVAQVPALQNRVTVAPPVPAQIQEITEEAAEKEENSSETLETAIPNQETSEITRSPAPTSRETKPIARSPFWNSGSITGLFSIVERTFFYMTGIDSRKLFDRSVSPFNQTFLRRLCLSFGLISASYALSLLFRNKVEATVAAGSVGLVAYSFKTAANAGSCAVATTFTSAPAAVSGAVVSTVAKISEADLWNQYNNLHYIIRWYLKYQGHSLEWCMRHGPKISQQLVDFIIEKGLLKKHW